MCIRDRHWITGSASREDAQSLRRGNDAILTGIGTVLADNPSLTDRTGLARRRPLLRIVLDSDLRTPCLLYTSPAALDLARPTRALIRVPDGAISSDLSLRSNGSVSNALHANVAVPMADDLHIISNLSLIHI